MDFLEVDFRMDPVFCASWLDSGYMFTSVYGGRALLPYRDAEADPMVSQTIEIPQWVVWFHRSFISPSCRRGSFPWSRLFVGS